MGKAVQMICCGDCDPKRAPQGTENLESLLDAAPSHLPRHPQRYFTGETQNSVSPISTSTIHFCVNKQRQQRLYKLIVSKRGQSTRVKARMN